MTLAGFSNSGAHGSRNKRFPSENISFRLPKNQLDQLRKEAEENRISLNTLVSQIVDSYVNFVSNAPKAGMIPVSKSVLIELLEGYNEEQIKSIAERSQKKIMIDRALQLRGKYDFETLVDIFVSWLRASGFTYRHDKDSENEGRHTFIIQHNMGRKYSLFLLECLKVNCEPLITGKVDYTVTDNCLQITGEGKGT